MEQTLKPLRPKPSLGGTQAPAPEADVTKGTAGEWCPATKALMDRYQRTGNKVKMAWLNKIMNKRGCKNGN